jgi:hypothetical protein
MSVAKLEVGMSTYEDAVQTLDTELRQVEQAFRGLTEADLCLVSCGAR